MAEEQSVAPENDLLALLTASKDRLEELQTQTDEKAEELKELRASLWALLGPPPGGGNTYGVETTLECKEDHRLQFVYDELGNIISTISSAGSWYDAADRAKAKLKTLRNWAKEQL